MRKRMKTVRGLWAGLLAAAVVLTSAAPSALTVQAEEADAVQTAEVSGVEYQIYPTPHEMTYQDGGFDIGEVNIVYENGVDDVTKNRMTEVLSIKGKSESAAVTNAKVDGKTNILAGIYGSIRFTNAITSSREGEPSIISFALIRYSIARRSFIFSRTAASSSTVNLDAFSIVSAPYSSVLSLILLFKKHPGSCP